MLQSEDTGYNVRKMTYTRDFLYGLKHLKYSPPESVIKFNELYVYAPKPQVHRPRVSHSASRGTRSTFAAVSTEERFDLHRKRMEDEKEKKANKQGRTPQKSHKSRDDNKLCGTPGGLSDTSKDQEVVEESGGAIRAILIDAREQESCLISQEVDDIVPSANKPASRSRIVRKRPLSLETDDRRLEQRRKQIGYGYATAGHANYLKLVPKDKRQNTDPQTPNALQVCSKRSWDGQLAKWRKSLHIYDTDAVDISTDDDMSLNTSLPLVTLQEREALAKMRQETKSKEQARKASIAENKPTIITTVEESTKCGATSATPAKPSDASCLTFCSGSFSSIFRIQVQVHICR